MTDLQRAIKLREWTRRADDVDDMDSLRELNRRADAAYLRLSPLDALAYREWAFRTLDAETARALGVLAASLLNTEEERT